ncbi:hypothetical protein B0H11DRAFT_1905365 [Mycena galericulata]|nr:hypothetical protein B0H11DRAFT_1905365 [Mycena galericulata]
MSQAGLFFVRERDGDVSLNALGIQDGCGADDEVQKAERERVRTSVLLCGRCDLGPTLYFAGAQKIETTLGVQGAGTTQPSARSNSTDRVSQPSLDSNRFDSTRTRLRGNTSAGGNVPFYRHFSWVKYMVGDVRNIVGGSWNSYRFHCAPVCAASKPATPPCHFSASSAPHTLSRAFAFLISRCAGGVWRAPYGAGEEWYLVPLFPIFTPLPPFFVGIAIYIGVLYDNIDMNTILSSQLHMKLCNREYERFCGHPLKFKN